MRTSNADLLYLTLRHQELKQQPDGRNYWDVIEAPETWPAAQTALLLCDMWDKHWSRGAMIREATLIPRTNAVVAAARAKGAAIIHAPSNTMAFYEGYPARQRALAVGLVEPSDVLQHADPPLPVDASDGGSDTNHGDESPNHRAWTRQHPDIEIDEAKDYIADDGRLVYSIMQSHKADRLLILGVHTNVCILNRSFAIKQMVRWGVRVALIRDLTDTMYNPALSPYVSHEEGTRLVVEYIEKFWCPTALSGDLLRA